MTKYKIGATLISLSIILFIFLFKKAFYQKIALTDWKELSSEDFKGLVKPFSKYDATIYYDIIVNYDSISRKYISRAVQKDKLSWIKNSAKNSYSLMRHEQYHFNIAEYHSRVLNQSLNNLSSKYKIDLEYKLDLIRNRNDKMQIQYDDETNHSLNQNKQNNWERRIDSLLKVESNNQEYTHELLNNYNYEKKWVNLINNDSIIGEIELYISKNKDTIWNQYKLSSKKETNSLKSFYYQLETSKSKRKDNHIGQITLLTNQDSLIIENLNISYLEQNRDSTWLTTKRLNSLDTISIKFENYYNNKLHGIICWSTIEIDSINNQEYINEHYLMIDNKNIVSDTFIKKFELSRKKKIKQN